MATSIRKTGAIILAGGKRELTPGLPKLLEEVEGVPVLHHVINASLGMSRINGDQSRITVVISDRFGDQLQESLNESFPRISIAVQENHLGTADAVWQAIFQNQYPDCQSVFVLMGDQPLITSQDLDAFHRSFVDDPLVRAGILAFEEYRQKPEFQKCGKVFFNGDSKFDRIETRSPTTGSAELLHAGPYLFEASWLRGALAMLQPHVDHHPEKEFHLYDALRGAKYDTGVRVCASASPEHFLGVDTKPALKEVRRRMADRNR